MALSPTGPQLSLTMLQERSAGTFARIYLAEAQGQDGLSRIVAVKVLKEQWLESEELIRRTRDEALLLARLRHKNILRVEAMTQIDGNPAIVMEFVDGVDLSQLIESKDGEITAFPPRAAYRIAMETASALHAAWARVPYGQTEPLRVVHRDVKPPNIMISVEGEVKVLDFGTARFTHDLRMAKTGMMRFGSMKYMSPERRNGARGEHSCDVYSLGLVIIEMLQGEMLPLLPIDANEHDDALNEIITNLDNLGLPDDAWEDSIRQALTCMCTASPDRRLSAEQVIDLMRAFTDNAHGDSLDAFAHKRVTQVARSIFGSKEQGVLTGSQVFIQIDGPEPGIRPLDTLPAPSTIQPLDDSSEIIPSEPEWTDDSAQRPTLAPRPTNDNGPGPANPSTELTTDKPKRHPVVLMTMILLPVFLLGAMGVGFLAKKYFEKEKRERSSRDDDDSRSERRTSEEPLQTSGNGTANGDIELKIVMDPGETEVRYIRLNDIASSDPLLRERPVPGAEAEPVEIKGVLPVGDYELSVKLRYGDEMMTVLTLNAPLELSCTPTGQKEVKIACTQDDEVQYILTNQRP